MDPFGLMLLAFLWMKNNNGGSPAPAKKAKLMPRPPPPRAPPPPRPKGTTSPKPKPLVSKDDVSFPGPNWTPYSPPPQPVIDEASRLLPYLHTEGPGATQFSFLTNRPVAFLAVSHGEKRAVTAWRLKKGVQLPKDWLAKIKAGKDAPPPKPAPSPKRPSPKPVAEAPEKSPITLPTLKNGSRGVDVKLLQGELGGLTADGIFGPKTELRVMEYQAENDLTVDGIVGAETWGHLLGGGFLNDAGIPHQHRSGNSRFFQPALQ